MDTQTTSRMRTALCRAICTTVMVHGDGTDKADLARRLDALPFERMGDQALVDMARHFVPAERVDAIVEKAPRDRYECTELYVCHQCRDFGWIGTPDEHGVLRMHRCQQCNPTPEPDAEPAPSKGRRK